ncbi:hypothetical protein BT63DRAFT_438668 [Microthyrium microscopicum]|uniref:BTB domain-containing protein n=1 Tax=Microthyrium microscopicum TaxID=703497 RepID=A0A6A6UHJ3_9PEZI|nr:hypothetical protein BT63DRAFT_438668 [Microthyrium microscopicum]
MASQSSLLLAAIRDSHIQRTAWSTTHIDEPMDKAVDMPVNKVSNNAAMKVFQPSGDLILVVGELRQKIKLASASLAPVSTVFQIMLNGRFKEAVDFKSSNKPYELHLPDDDYLAIATLCDLIHHQGRSPPKWLTGKVTKTQSNFDKLEPEVHFFRKFALAADKYQLTAVTTHFAGNWLTQLSRWSNGESFGGVIPGRQFWLRLDLCEIAALLRQDQIFEEVTQNLLLRGCNYQGLQNWRAEIEHKYPGLPDAFVDFVYRRNRENREGLHGLLTNLKDLLCIGQTQDVLDDIRLLPIHGYFKGPKCSPELTLESMRRTFEAYRLGTHDIMLMGGFATAINKYLLPDEDQKNHGATLW